MRSRLLGDNHDSETTDLPVFVHHPHEFWGEAEVSRSL